MIRLSVCPPVCVATYVWVHIHRSSKRVLLFPPSPPHPPPNTTPPPTPTNNTPQPTNPKPTPQTLCEATAASPALLDAESCGKLLAAAERLGCPALKKRCVEYLIAHPEEVTAHPSFARVGVYVCVLCVLRVGGLLSTNPLHPAPRTYLITTTIHAHPNNNK